MGRAFQFDRPNTIRRRVERRRHLTHSHGTLYHGGSVDGTLRTLDVRAGRMHVDDLGRGQAAGPGRGDDSSRESLHVPAFTLMVLFLL